MITASDSGCVTWKDSWHPSDLTSHYKDHSSSYLPETEPSAKHTPGYSDQQKNENKLK